MTNFNGMKDFYPFYLGEHKNPWTKAWHIVGTLGFIASIVLAIVYWPKWWLIFPGIVFAYACAWLSHFLIEHNRPATFKNPLLSLASDFRMAMEVLTGKRGLGSRRSSDDEQRQGAGDR